ncbi:MAG: hypothetical protein GY714_14055 [Desulfobacterales bacterium]|nr:hypothetical protein [Desulfobacterales bacterium]
MEIYDTLNDVLDADLTEKIMSWWDKPAVVALGFKNKNYQILDLPGLFNKKISPIFYILYVIEDYLDARLLFPELLKKLLLPSDLTQDEKNQIARVAGFRDFQHFLDQQK